MKARLASVVLFITFVPQATAQTTSRVSVSSSGSQANGDSGDGGPSISADGRYVAFASNASDLVAGDTNTQWDIFVRDLTLGITNRISVDSSGVQGNLPSWRPSISADGRYVAFSSDATNLILGDTDAFRDIFVHDCQTGTTERVSLDSAGTPIGSSDFPSISSDGRYVAFETGYDVYVRDRQLNTTECVSLDSSGGHGNNFSALPSISADGRYIAFYSYASNLVPRDTNGTSDVFVRDCQFGITERVSVDSSGAQGNGVSGGGDILSISGDGRYVAFESFASNLVSGDTNGTFDVFVHDRQSHVTERVSVASSGAEANSGSLWPSMSSDGRYVAFHSYASNLDEYTTSTPNVFVRDRLLGITKRISVDSLGAQENGPSVEPSISVGGHVAFDSVASNLVPRDTNSSADVFVHSVPAYGIDISYSARSPTATQWQAIAALGNAVAVVEGWTGRHKNTYAGGQLLGARTAGLRTAGYCQINFDNGAPNGPANQDGGWQVGQALSAFGPETINLSFIAIDIESAYPLVIGLSARVERINESVRACRYAGLPAVIYTSRADWSSIANGTGAFSDLPLWESHDDHDADLNFDRHQTWQSFGGWIRRQGKQYLVDTPSQPVRLLGIPVDYDLFDPTLFR